MMRRMSSLMATIATVLALGGSVLSASTPQVSISAGTLQGGLCENNSTVAYYKSISYAKPPTGDLRYASPEAYNQTWNGVRKATTSAPSCIQFGTQFLETGQTSEDW
jgi:carboxylesterase type B